jgi:hypothetical protein
MDSVCGHVKLQTRGFISARVCAQLFGVSFLSVFHTTSMNATAKLAETESALAADTLHGSGPSDLETKLEQIRKMRFPHKFELLISARVSDPGGS